MTNENQDLNQDNNAVPATPVAEAKASGWGRKVLIGAGTLLAIGGIGVAVAVGSGFHHGRHGMMRDFAEFRMNRMLDEVGASADQKAKIETIFKTTLDEVRPERGQFREMRDQATTLLKAPTIDRAAIEALRAKQIARMDEKSKLIAKAIGDAAEVLTPDQRAKLVEEFDQMRRFDEE